MHFALYTLAIEYSSNVLHVFKWLVWEKTGRALITLALQLGEQVADLSPLVRAA